MLQEHTRHVEASLADTARQLVARRKGILARALQANPLVVWAGDQKRFAEAQQAFLHRARVTSAAREGAHTGDLERDPGRVAHGGTRR